MSEVLIANPAATNAPPANFQQPTALRAHQAPDHPLLIVPALMVTSKQE